MNIKQKFIQHVSSALSDAYDNKSKVSQDILDIQGMSGTKTRHFYNNILNIDDARYLEIGTWMGSTACAAMYKNNATVVCIDNWSEFEGNIQTFLNNFNKYKGSNKASFIELDCFSLDVSKLPKFNIYMYDGNHKQECHYNALKYFLPCLDDTFIFVVDDWNWEHNVRNPTYKAIEDLKLTIDYEKTIIVPDELFPDKNGWWNGIGIFVLTKPSTNITMNFTESEINEIYKKKVKLPDEYFKKYEVLPECPIVYYKNGWAGHDYPRNRCILDFRDWVKKHNLEYIEHIAYTIKDDPELQFLNFIKRTELPFPPYNLHTLSEHFKDEFDFFLFNQTLEHLYNPFAAVKEIHASLKPGGYVFTSVPTLNIPHLTPSHFGGFTPMGLAMLFKSVNFEIVEMGQWGNYDYIEKLFKTHHWPDINDLKTPSGIIKNEEHNVCQCWILARKTNAV